MWILDSIVFGVVSLWVIRTLESLFDAFAERKRNRENAIREEEHARAHEAKMAAILASGNKNLPRKSTTTKAELLARIKD